nr:MAG TPA: host-nuclease inhibitor protein [Caudoviricetes sp.]
MPLSVLLKLKDLKQAKYINYSTNWRKKQMAKTRIKQPAIEAAQDKAEVTAFIRKIGDLQREVKRLETEAGDKKAVIEEEYAAKAAPMCAEIMSLTERVAAYCKAHKDELTDNGKTKTVDFTTGLIKWRIRPPSVKVTGVAAVLAWLSEKSAFAEFVRTKKEIDKDAILNQKERFSDGQVPGIKIVSGVEDFVIEPTEQIL